MAWEVIGESGGDCLNRRLNGLHGFRGRGGMVGGK